MQAATAVWMAWRMRGQLSRQAPVQFAMFDKGNGAARDEKAAEYAVRRYAGVTY